jgi:hypothetical protein
MRPNGRIIKEGYKTLTFSEEEDCISRVGAILLILNDQWNVANRRVTDCRRCANNALLLIYHKSIMECHLWRVSA